MDAKVGIEGPTEVSATASTCTSGSPIARSDSRASSVSRGRLLYRQFGVDPARAGEANTVQNFRKDCLRELKKIKIAWPDLHYQAAKGALVVSPSPPRIPPSQLRLREP